MDKQTLRQDLIRQRKQLNSDKAESDSRILCDQLLLHPRLHKWRQIGVYIAVGHEASLESFIKECWQQGKQLYAPKVYPDKTMQLHFYSHEDPLIKNKFHIPEPTSPIAHPIESLDVLLLPGVAFDSKGHRLGMGGGYYDKLLSYKREKPFIKPYLIGVGYDFQCLHTIPAQTHDILMNEVITPNKKRIISR